MPAKDKSYTLFWRTGVKEVVTGRTPAEAMNLAGYGQGAVRALDFYASGDYTLPEKANEYIFNPERRQWESREIRELLTKNKETLGL